MSGKYATYLAYCWGVFTTTLGALSLDEWAVIIGIFCTVLTAAVNWYYKRKDFQLRKENAAISQK
ncbi:MULTISPECIES: phage holin family protein [Klebsiella pneumoniae complex]|uniref:phage holin family protein n=1 Tax=Klebsiella pneumoniae complex TaxID=3390273 RepID=UPI001255CF44|nr:MULTISPECIES: phage holin family protein [Klebsiella]VAP72360.1 holin domain protein [Klebsiella pneumoniae]HBW3346602.1 holin [Klebsiella pneumoniae]